jgi:hypothetical protein
MRCSAAKILLTPEAPVPLSGNGGRPEDFRFVRSDLEANVVCVAGRQGKVVLVAIDTLFASNQFRDAVMDHLASALKAEIHDLIMVASHTHNAPALDPTKPLLGRLDDAYFNFASRQVAAAVTIAMSQDPTATTLASGTASCDLNASRRRKGVRVLPRPPFLAMDVNLSPVHNADVPRNVRVICARDDSGQPLFVLWSWTCHATAGADRLAVSADFPGAVRDALRAKLEKFDLPILFWPGFCGDIRADPAVWPMSFQRFLMVPFQRPFARPTPANYAMLCTAVSAAAVRALDCAVLLEGEPDNDGSAVRVSVPLQRLMTNDDERSIDLVLVRLGPLSILGVGAEICSPYLAKLVPLLPPDALLTGYTGDVACYLPDDRQIAEGGYEAKGFFASFSIAPEFTSRVEHHIVDAVRDLMRTVSN